MIPSNPSSSDFFEAKYQAVADPWNFASDPYEQNRYAAILRALGPRRFLRAWEPGCSVGVLTEQLAAICEHVEACDFSPAAVDQAKLRCQGFPNVSVRCASVTDLQPVAASDLILLSEIGYYLTLADWQNLVTRIVDAMMPGATLLASHWLGHSPDHILSGDQVHGVLMDLPGLVLERDERHLYEPDSQKSGFRLDRWRKS